MSFNRNIRKYVESEINAATRLLDEGKPERAFTHLENAHVLGQKSTKWHTLVHLKMFNWAVKNRNAKEALGQIFRIIGATTKTVFGCVPEGNTGGTNVNPFKPMTIGASHRRIIDDASSS